MGAWQGLHAWVSGRAPSVCMCVCACAHVCVCVCVHVCVCVCVPATYHTFSFLSLVPLNQIASNYTVIISTGHGVGAALNVHEGPQRISKSLGGNHAQDLPPQPLLPGMVLSNEPGYYEEAKSGGTEGFGVQLR